MKRVFELHLLLIILAVLVISCSSTPNNITISPNQNQCVQSNMYSSSVTPLALIANNPQNAKLIDLGLSDSGLPIEGVAIGNGPVQDLVVSTHHGNEYGSTFVTLAFAQAMGKFPLEGRTINIVPVLNIDGYNDNNRYEPYRSEGVMNMQDPNRDYPGPCGSEGGGPWRLKSTKLLDNFVVKQNIASSLTLHTYSSVVVYPWGMGEKFSIPYLDIYTRLANFVVELSGYKTGNNVDLLYSANGTYEDYAIWRYGVWTLLMELGKTHSPSQSQMQEMARVNVPGMRKFFENAPSTRMPKHDYDGRCTKGFRIRLE